MLWSLQPKYGWNDGFERIEGFLLGYEREIDKSMRARTEE
jgi:hypothetical protein